MGGADAVVRDHAADLSRGARGADRIPCPTGDTLLAIAGRLGADWRTVATANRLGNPDRLYPGQRLAVEITRIVPATRANGIVINVPEAMLYYFEDGRLVFHAGVGLGKPGRWQTPIGPFTIHTKERHPSWSVPISIQQEMEVEGQVVVSQVPPGPENPLGEFWLGLSIPGYGIHSTIAPSSIGQYRSHGCIRMHPKDIRALFSLVRAGALGELVYLPVKIALVDGKVYVEAHRDVYGLKTVGPAEIEETLRMLDVPIDPARVRAVVAEQASVGKLVSPGKAEEGP